LDDLEPTTAGQPQAAAGTFDGDTLEMERPSFEEPEATTTTASDDDFDSKAWLCRLRRVAAGVAGASAAAPTDDFGTDDFGTPLSGARDTGTQRRIFRFADFGSGLGGGTEGISSETVYSILQAVAG
jgi:hypothetical protein